MMMRKLQPKLIEMMMVLMEYGCGVVLELSMGYTMFTTGKPWWLIKIIERVRKRFLNREANSGELFCQASCGKSRKLHSLVVGGPFSIAVLYLCFMVCCVVCIMFSGFSLTRLFPCVLLLVYYLVENLNRNYLYVFLSF
ncbi:hypothetical protein PVK06_041539 [Gossypium arboreum]|uniref:Transmembrane protein n=1 Tax=Gossypium arboreum TaxID=29729 RepID=A0ABR0N8T9_GOSAR|nr:hypothetical protein PVK06_041539 [Gossypium arboreum]